MCAAATPYIAAAALGYQVYSGEKQYASAQDGIKMQKKTLDEQTQRMKEQASAAPDQATNETDDFAKQRKLQKFRAGIADTVKTNPLAQAAPQTQASAIYTGTKERLGA
jgi:erythromycin esterase-like protein